jgi:hypothetical protein
MKKRKTNVSKSKRSKATKKSVNRSNNKKSLFKTTKKAAKRTKRKQPKKQPIQAAKKKSTNRNRKSGSTSRKSLPVVKAANKKKPSYPKATDDKPFFKDFYNKNRITISVGRIKSFEKKGKKWLEVPKKLVNKYLNKNKIKNGVTKVSKETFQDVDDGIVKEPRAVMVTIKIKHPEKGSFYKSKISPNDMVVNAENIEAFVQSYVNEYNSDMLDIIAEYDEEISPYNIQQISVIFLY